MAGGHLACKHSGGLSEATAKRITTGESSPRAVTPLSSPAVSSWPFLWALNSSSHVLCLQGACKLFEGRDHVLP